MAENQRFAGAVVQRGSLYMKDAEKYEANMDTPQDATDTSDTQNTVDPIPNAQKESTDWQKRYTDLQSFTSKQNNEKEKAIKELQEQVSQLQKSQATKAYPKTMDELQAWMGNYPDLADAIITLAGKQSESVMESYTKKHQELEEKLEAIAQDKFRNDLRKVHPDCDEIEQDPKFADWFGKQRPAIQQLVQSKDLNDVIYAINLYKSDMGLTKEAVKEKQKEASKMIDTGASKPEKTPSKKVWKESEIMKIPSNKYSQVAEEIEAAQAEGRIEYDISLNKL